MSVLCVTLHFFTNRPQSRKPQGCFTTLLLSSHIVHRDVSPQHLVMKSTGFFLVSSNFACQQDCNSLWSPSQQCDISSSLSLLLRKSTNKWVMDENSGKAVSQVFRANCFWPPCTLESRLGQLLHQDEEPQLSRAGCPSPSGQSWLSLCWPSAPAAKLRGLASAVACALPPTNEEHLLVA